MSINNSGGSFPTQGGSGVAGGQGAQPQIPQDPARTDFINQVWDKATQLAKLPKTAQAIPVPKFCQAYLSCLSATFTDVDLACLVVIFSDHGEQEEQLPLVSKRQFDLFLLRFGPPNKSLQKINNVLVNGKVWFHGNQGREASERLLREKPKEGLFLLRYSSVPGAFTVDYIKRNKICRFNNIRNDPQGGVEVVVGRPPKQQAYKYSTMDTFITKNAHIFQRPALNARSHFQWLKLRIPSAGSVRTGAGTATGEKPGSSSSGESEDGQNAAMNNATPEERVAQAIQQSYKTDKTVLSLRGFGIGPVVPPQVCVLKFLVNLDLSKNKLTSIPPRLSALKDLETLTLSNNQLTDIPGGVFSGLSRLGTFHCSENQLVEMPSEFYTLTALTYVDLSQNKLKKISPDISKLNQLQFLDISNNELESLPSLAELKEIEELLVGSNKLREVPRESATLPNMIALDVSNNMITSIPEEIITRLKEEASFSFDIVGNKNLSNADQAKIKAVMDARAKLKPQGGSSVGGQSSVINTGESRDVLELIRDNIDLNEPATELSKIEALPAEAEPPVKLGREIGFVNGGSLWLVTGRDFRLEECEVGKKTLDPSDLIIREYSNKSDYRRYFYQKVVHANIIGDEKNLGPICVSIQKEPDPTVTADDPGAMATVAGQIAGGMFLEGTATNRSFYRVLVRSKQNDRSTVMSASQIKVRKREKYARSDDLLAALKKILNLFSTRNLYVIRDTRSHKVFADLESKLISNSSKFGVLYAFEGQGETEMYNNLTENLTPGFEEFLELLSKKINMHNWPKYRGDLSNKVSQISRYTEYKGHEIMLHVSNYLKYQEVTDAAHQQWERKRFLGNDIVIIVYYEGKKPIDPSTFVSNFNHVFAIVQPVMVNGKQHYRLQIVYKYGVDKSHPILPEDPIFSKEQIRDVLLTKLVNSERCAMSAPQFRRAQEKVRAELFADLQKQFPKKSRKKETGGDMGDSGYITKQEEVETLKKIMNEKKANLAQGGSSSQ